MENLFEHLKDLFLEASFEENQSAFSITVYTNLDYAADQVYAHVKRHRGKKNGHIQRNRLIALIKLIKTHSEVSVLSQLNTTGCVILLSKFNLLFY